MLDFLFKQSLPVVADKPIAKLGRPVVCDVERDTGGQSDVESAEFECIDVGGEIDEKEEAFLDVADVVAEIRRDGQGMGVILSNLEGAFIFDGTCYG